MCLFLCICLCLCMFVVDVCLLCWVCLCPFGCSVCVCMRACVHVCVCTRVFLEGVLSWRPPQNPRGPQLTFRTTIALVCPTFPDTMAGDSDTHKSSDVIVGAIIIVIAGSLQGMPEIPPVPTHNLLSPSRSHLDPVGNFELIRSNLCVVVGLIVGVVVNVCGWWWRWFWCGTCY